MKNQITWTGVVFLGLISSVNFGWSAQQEVPVGIQKIFAPSRGYDDNDTVRVVLAGELPNPCHLIGKTRVEKSPVTGAYVVTQMAWVRTDGICGLPDLNDDPVPFEVDVPIGVLTSGNYRVEVGAASVPQDAAVATRSFRVDRSVVASIDSLNYAMVSDLWIDDVVFKGQAAKVTLSGRVTTDCAAIADPIAIQKQDDVFVVLPIQTGGPGCKPILVPFKKELNLGVLPAGVYMIHVRSRSGKAIQKVFTVVDQA